jgi:hypothetical protein
MKREQQRATEREQEIQREAVIEREEGSRGTEKRINKR